MVLHLVFCWVYSSILSLWLFQSQSLDWQDGLFPMKLDYLHLFWHLKSLKTWLCHLAWGSQGTRDMHGWLIVDMTIFILEGYIFIFLSVDIYIFYIYFISCFYTCSFYPIVVHCPELFLVQWTVQIWLINKFILEFQTGYNQIQTTTIVMISLDSDDKTDNDQWGARWTAAWANPGLELPPSVCAIMLFRKTEVQNNKAFQFSNKPFFKPRFRPTLFENWTNATQSMSFIG